LWARTARTITRSRPADQAAAELRADAQASSEVIGITSCSETVRFGANDRDVKEFAWRDSKQTTQPFPGNDLRHSEESRAALHIAVQQAQELVRTEPQLIQT
jgi:hypothetical protein